MADFDRIAPAYRWMEYLTLGRALERCRGLHLDRLAGARQALVLGDGDGRFTAGLLARNASVHVTAVDSSAAMLALLSKRAHALEASSRLTAIHADALSWLASPATGHYDCVCTHFFLDCLPTAAVEQLARQATARLTPGALWIVSEFATPTWWARLIVALLYRAFALLTGLETQRLPRWREALEDCGFTCVAEQPLLRGLLTSTVWRRPEPESLPHLPAQGNRTG